MRTLLIILLLLTAPVHAQHGGGAPSPEDRSKPPSEASKIIERMTIPPLKWQVPAVGRDVQRHLLPNGIVVYMREDHTLPIVEAQVIVRTGDIFETKAQHGVAELTGTVLRTGGTTALSPDDLNKKLEMMSATIETSIGTESGSASLNVLSKDLDAGLQLLADVVRRPRFAEDEVELARAQIHEALRSRNDDAGDISARELNVALYREHPYGWILDWDVVKGIKRDDLVKWHGTYFHPAARTRDGIWSRPNIMIAVSGDFSSKSMLATLTRLFGDWQQAPVAAPRTPPVVNQPNPGVFLVKKDVSQSDVRVGHLSVNRESPDRIVIGIMNYILGGGSFTSRVMEKIRNDEGLAYSVGTYFSIDSTDLGSFGGYLQTRSETTAKAIQLLLAEIRRMSQGQVTDRELADAKDAYANSFVFSFNDASETVSRLMMLEYHGQPLDWYQTWLDRVKSVTRQDVERVAKQYLQPDKLTIVVVGDPAKFDAKLDALGPVKNVPLRVVE